MSWKNTHPYEFSNVYTTNTHGIPYGADIDDKKYHFEQEEWADVLVTLKGTLREKETHFVRKVKQAGGFVSVDRGAGSHGDDRYYIHIPGEQHGNSIEYKCPFCRERYKKNGFPYLNSKHHTHVHGALGFDSSNPCYVSPHCPNACLAGNYPNEFIFFGMRRFLIQVDVINLKTRDQCFPWKQSENEVILDHDEFPNKAYYTDKSEFSYITSFFSQEDLP